ncbi:hypothetical protein [uncultured Roseobacter sp.]|uniref:hypothetical protein n=1 Tax=uncultured Roseobacter sp. TaxID=114847 RepID=UPI00261210FF|nr:hypothetical protein [uncultured Roseobacter sp.]
MKNFWMGPLAAMLCAVAGAVPAAETIYGCEATYVSKQGFVGPEIYFFLDEEKGTVRVLDGVVQSVTDGPMAGKLTKRSNSIYRVNWTVANIKGRTTELTVNYTGNLYLEKNKYTISAVVRGYDNKVRGEGRCKILK